MYNSTITFKNQNVRTMGILQRLHPQLVYVLLLFNWILYVVKLIEIKHLSYRPNHPNRACCFVCGVSNVWVLVIHHLSYKKLWNHVKHSIISKSVTYNGYKAKRKWSPIDIISQIEATVKRIEYHVHLFFEIFTNPENFLVFCKNHHDEMENNFTRESKNLNSEQIQKNFEGKFSYESA